MNADALHRSGLIAFQSGQKETALSLIQRAASLQPGVAEYQSNLGVVLSAMGRTDEAIAALERAIALRPNLIDAMVNLGNTLHRAGRHAEAIAAYRRALTVSPSQVAALNGLGSALKSSGDLDGAIAAFMTATQARPDFTESFINLGDALNEADRVSESLQASRRAIELSPASVEAHNNLGLAHLKAHQFTAANAAFRRGLDLNPNSYQALNNLGCMLKEIGQVEEAIACFDRALAIRPDLPNVDSNRVHNLLRHPAYDAAALLGEHRLWNQRHATPLKNRILPHANDRSPDRRLRIGYVSPDFHEHVVARNILPLFREHDHAQFEVFCYSNTLASDSMTHRLRACADHWRDIRRTSDDSAAELIRHDAIDILVDLALHTSGNRLLIFARKPAPIQATFGGYPGGTGMEAIDYRLTDPYLDPQETDADYAENSIRLPETFWCYDAEGMKLADSPPVTDLPALTSGHITFGSLNDLSKINDRVLSLWRRVLDECPDSRLTLLAPPAENRQRTTDALNGRVDFAEWLPRAQYMARYQQIDLGLDTFPYNGHTTSLDSFWMGVPVITLIGHTVVGRAGLSQLSNLNLHEFAARSPDEFVSIAAALARDLPRLAQLRSTLRDRMKASPIMDAPRFARNIESAYRQMWHHWSRP